MSAPSPSAPAARFEQLDALRAFAVVAVVACHTLDRSTDPWAAWGAHGVALFFVLSGFLITGILIDARARAETRGLGMGGVIRSFAMRRVLRILPLYVVTLAVATVIGVRGMREDLGWHALYLSNWKIAADGHWPQAAHLWSLAVEEQFYLVWPWMVLFVSRRALPWAIGLMMAIGVGTRVALAAGTSMWSEGIAILTPSTFDALGAGAMLALLWRRVRPFDRWVSLAGVAGLCIIVAGTALEHRIPAQERTLEAVTMLGWPLVFAWCVHSCARGVGGRVGRFLRSRPVIHVGTVSYGIYLVHLFVEPAARIAERRLGLHIPVPAHHGVTQFVVVLAISIAAATLSWTLLERPINRLKDRFPYVQQRSPADAVPEATQPRRFARAVGGRGGT